MRVLRRVATTISAVIIVVGLASILGGCSKPADGKVSSSASAPATPIASAPVPSASPAFADTTPDTQPGTTPGSFALAIVDSLTPEEFLRIEPIAHFTGTEWIHGWPNPDDAGSPVPSLQDVPEAWLGRPVPRAWALWIGTGAPINVIAMRTFREKGGCSVPILLELNKRATDLGRSEIHGLAMSTTQAVTAMQAVGPSDEERRDIVAAATTALLERRDKAVGAANLRAQDRGALADTNLARVPITLDYLYRPAGSGRDIYYFQVDQWTKADDMEAPHISVWGWLRRDGAGRLQPTQLQARAGAGSEEGMMSRERQKPLAVIAVGGRTFWIMQDYGLESFFFDIYEIAPNEIRQILTGVGGGGC